jgi:ribonucleoside-diphosphate reductase alpha chain
MDDYQRFIHASRYARFRDDLGRRETWEETVERLVEYYWEQIEELAPCARTDGFEELEDAIKNMEVMPSMRAMMTAGPALDRCNVGAYNCAYLPVDSPRSFDEAMYILMCGTGVGFSVEEKYVSQLPRITEDFSDTDTVIVVDDSKEGWAKSFREIITLLIAGQVPKWDVSRVRPAGARLRTFGGRASGPEPLVRLFEFAVRLFRGAKGRKLTPLECHDLMCMVADVVVVGGVRRSAMISLSDLSNESLANAKGFQRISSYLFLGMEKEKPEDEKEKHKYTIQFENEGVKHNLIVYLEQYDAEMLEKDNQLGWWVLSPFRQLANNSAVFNGKPEVGEFLKEWKSLYDSKSGERGIFNRDASKRIVERLGKRDPNHEFGTNPCSEIILRPFQFCNLTEVVVRPGDGLEDLKRKVRLATILGTIQSTFTDFRYLRKVWQRNTEEERLLGVSLTGIADNKLLFGTTSGELLNELKELANEVNQEWADRLGIPRSAAVTCVKPSGTVSQLVNSASGIHPRWSKYYLRSVRNDVKDPISKFLQESGVPNEPDQRNPAALVFYFPQQSPDTSVVRSDVSAVDFLDIWKSFQEHWCEHKPSVTVSVAEDEWLPVAAWVYDNFHILSGVSFLPFDPTEYPQAPYQTLTEEQYHEWVQKMPETIDWSRLKDYEGGEDYTTGSQELACVGGLCEV